MHLDTSTIYRDVSPGNPRVPSAPSGRRNARNPLRGGALSGRRLSAVELNGAGAIVTGGASGIGAATARQLADLGAHVVIADMQAERGRRSPREIGGVFVPVDVTNTGQIIDAVNTASDLGPLRALVNSAGVGWAQRTIGRTASSPRRMTWNCTRRS